MYMLISTRSGQLHDALTNFDADQIHVGDLLAPGQVWYNYDTGELLQIDKVNTKNATFAGTYKKIDETFTVYFPFCGEFDPIGITVGWVVSYWNDHVNYHSIGVWTGYARVTPESLESLRARWQLLVSRLIAHQDSSNTTSGHGIIFEHLGV